MESSEKVMGWGTIIAIMVGIALAVGLLLGLMGQMFGIPTQWTGAGVGVSAGVVGASLISRRRAALDKRSSS